MTIQRDIFEYTDYRAFLRDYYKRLKGRGFSFRAFSQRAGLGSPNYLKLVIDNKRNLSGDMAERFATACNLEGEHARFFVTLVRYNQAKDSVTRLREERRLYTFTKYRRVHQLRSELTDYYTTWFVPVVRELAVRRDFEHDPKWIARQIRPRITVTQAKRALSILDRTGMLIQDQNGKWVQADPLVSTPQEIPSPAVAAFHRAMMDLASQAIDTVDRADRDLSSLTLCVPNKQIAEIKSRIQDFRRELLKFSTTGEDPGQVVQLNMQFFPVSKPPSVPKTPDKDDTP